MSQPGAWRAARATVIGLLLGLLLTQNGLTLMRVDGASMLPTLTQGQVVLVLRPPLGALIGLLTRQRQGAVKRGSVVVLPDPFIQARPPGWGRPLIVKRVVGLPGERVTLSRGQLLIDGRALPEPWLDPGHAVGATSRETAVPAGHLYLLGDNRLPLASSDSRQFGPQPAASLRGLVVAQVRSPLAGGQLRWPLAPLGLGAASQAQLVGPLTHRPYHELDMLV